MTLVVTMATKSGIVMGADSKISMWNPETKKFLTPQSLDAMKIIPMEAQHMAASFWGQLDIHLKSNNRSGIVRKNLINDIFPDFVATLSDDDNVDSVSEKFRDYINASVDFSRLEVFAFGIHMAGYVEEDGRKCPKVRHVCLSPNDDKDPQQKDPSKFKNNNESLNSVNPQYAMVFNGFYFIVDALINWVSINYGDSYSMFNPQKMNNPQAIRCVNYLINITKGFQSYVQAPKLVGGCVNILTINSNGQYEWYKNSKKLKVNQWKGDAD